MFRVIDFVILTVIFGYWVNAKFPTQLERCKLEDSECIRKVAQTILDKYANVGISELNLEKIDPLYSKELSTRDVEESTLSAAYHLNLDLKDIVSIGYAKSTIENIEFRKKNNKIKMFIQFKLPRLDVEAKYKIDGSLLNILPINGDGIIKVRIENPIYVLKGTANLVNRNGDDYIAIDKFQARYNTTRVHTNLSNLFNGNVELGRTINEFINNNWKELFNGFSRPYFELEGVVFRGIISKIFDTIPFKELFL